jgi:hypothetical protein
MRGVVGEIAEALAELGVCVFLVGVPLAIILIGTSR